MVNNILKVHENQSCAKEIELFDTLFQNLCNNCANDQQIWRNHCIDIVGSEEEISRRSFLLVIFRKLSNI